MSLNLYISCTDSQREEVERLCVHLYSLKQRDVNIFSRFDLRPGDEWKAKIENELNKASIILCLVNVDYICEQEDEIERLQEIFELKIKTIVPILLSDCLLDFSFFNRLTPIKFEEKDKNDSGKLWKKTANFLSNYIQDNSKKELKITDFSIAPYKASAGKNNEYGQFQSESIKAVEPKNLLRGGLRFEIEGDSMSPFINHGDIVDTQKCENGKEVIDNKIYVIETKRDGIIIKLIKMNKSDVTLISLNNNYPDFAIDKQEIKSFWKVIDIDRSK